METSLYCNYRIRTLIPRALVNFYNLPVELLNPESDWSLFVSRFPLAKLPALVGPGGVKLTEVLAVNQYLVKLIPDVCIQQDLLGAFNNAMEQAQILRWQSFANSEIIPDIATLMQPLQGKVPFNKRSYDETLSQLNKKLMILENRLKEFTYLVNDRITLADLFTAALLKRGFQFLFGKQWRDNHPGIVRWFTTVIDCPVISAEFQDFEFIEEAVEPPKKPKGKPEKKDAKKDSNKTDETQNEPSSRQKKEEHPLKSLGPSTFILDEWKRKYSNEETREVALPWFWDNLNIEEYSLWKVDYKYNDELALTFMSNNLIGGFFNRLSASIKFMFGAMVVYGENNNNGIMGAIMLRGQDYKKAFNVAPDWESYNFVKLDPSKKEDREYVNDMWAWDKPVFINGVFREIVDGKVLK